MADDSGDTRAAAPADWLDRNIDMLSTLLLTLATIATAWCAFQASVWGGQQGLRLAESAAANREAMRLDLAANQELALDATVFMSYLTAKAEGEHELAAFYQQRFPPRLQQAFEAWLKTEPLESPDAPPHPFALPSYRQQSRVDAEAQKKVAEERRAAAAAVNHYSDMYTLATVMLATVLFFAGIASKPETRSARLTLLSVATVELAVVVIAVTTLPLAQL